MADQRPHIITRTVVGALLFAAAFICWAEAELSTRVADVHRRMATLQVPISNSIEGRLTTVGWLSAAPGSLDVEVRSQGGKAKYWLARYEELVRPSTGAGEDADPEALLMAANAAFRVAERGLTRETAAARLDTVLQAYATAIKTGGFSADAAYNYEYVARLRDTLSRPRAPGARSATPVAAEPTTGDLPSGPTIHGRPGVRPAPVRGNEFEILTPMEYGERESQPEATPGRKLPRKG